MDSTSATVSSFATSARVVVVIVNYRGWRDSIECLRSLLRSTHTHFTAIVVDNASPDDSWGQLERWATGDADVSLANSEFAQVAGIPMETFSYTACFDYDGQALCLRQERGRSTSLARLVLIHHHENVGFAAANNLALRYARENQEPDYYWFLNNDTVVDADAMIALVRHGVGRVVVGARLMEYDQRERLQTWGGGRLWSLIGYNRNTTVPGAPLDYLTGASIFLSLAALRDIGRWDDRYFLTWEDIEFSQRALAKGYRLQVAESAIVYHKGTVAIGRRSALDVYQRTLNGLRYIARHHPFCLPTTILAYLLKFPRGLIQSDPTYLCSVARAFRDFLIRR